MTYAYEFNDENAPPPQSSIPGLTFPLRAYHTAELQYLFIGDFFGLPVTPLTPIQMRLSDAMISYWTQFAKTGDPNSPGEPVWSPYNALTDEFQSLIPPRPVVESNFDADHRCSTFWNNVLTANGGQVHTTRSSSPYGPEPGGKDHSNAFYPTIVHSEKRKSGNNGEFEPVRGSESDGEIAGRG